MPLVIRGKFLGIFDVSGQSLVFDRLLTLWPRLPARKPREAMQNGD